MNSELKEKLDEFIKEFLEVKEVKQYLLLKEEIVNSQELKDLQEDLKQSQKNMALSLGTSFYEENKKKYLSLKEKYENHPLVINFNVMQEEVSYLLKTLENKLKI